MQYKARKYFKHLGVTRKPGDVIEPINQIQAESLLRSGLIVESDEIKGEIRTTQVKKTRKRSVYRKPG